MFSAADSIRSGILQIEKDSGNPTSDMACPDSIVASPTSVKLGHPHSISALCSAAPSSHTQPHAEMGQRRTAKTIFVMQSAAAERDCRKSSLFLTSMTELMLNRAVLKGKWKESSGTLTRRRMRF
jgi:hypothetical protein